MADLVRGFILFAGGLATAMTCAVVVVFLWRARHHDKSAASRQHMPAAIVGFAGYGLLGGLAIWGLLTRLDQPLALWEAVCGAAFLCGAYAGYRLFTDAELS